MKLLFSIAALLFGLNYSTGYAQTKPEKVHSIVKVYKSYEWYVEQHGLWEKELKKNKKSGEVWENLYASARMAKIMAPDTAKRNEWYKKMESLVPKMEKAIPKTYEYYHIKCWNSSIWGSSEDEVAKINSWAEAAYKIDPNRTEIYPDLMNTYMISGNTEKMEELSKRWLKSGDISPNLLALTYNLLQSTEENSILISCGDNDTYPALVLQYGAGIRKDVTLINMYCGFGNATYRNRLLKRARVPETSDINNHIEMLKYIVKTNTEKPLYFSYGNYLNDEVDLADKTYNVGLALKYSEEEFNNTSTVINNFENKYLLDQLKFSTSPEKFPEQVKRHNLTYLPGLMILYKHYKTVDDSKKMADTQALILKIAEGTPHEETVKENMKNC